MDGSAQNTSCCQLPVTAVRWLAWCCVLGILGQFAQHGPFVYGAKPGFPVRRAEIYYGAKRVDVPSPQEVEPEPAPVEQLRIARELLVEARAKARSGDVQGAVRLVEWARRLPVDWSSEPDSPDSLLRELVLRAANSDQVPGNERPHAATPNETSASPHVTRLPTTLDAGIAKNSRPVLADEHSVPETLEDNPLRDESLESLETGNRTAGFSSTEVSAGSHTGSLIGSIEPWRPTRTEPLLRSPLVDLAPKPLTPAAALPLADPARRGDSGAAALSYFVVGFLFCLVVLAPPSVFLLKQLQFGGAATYRVELVNNAVQAMMTPQLAPASPPAPAVEPSPATAAQVDVEAESVPALTSPQEPLIARDGAAVYLEGTDQPFMLPPVGDTFDEQRRREDEERRQREEAMVQFMFEKNLELREMFSTLPAGAN